MLNLVLLDEEVADVGEGEACLGFAVDSSVGRLYVITSSGEVCCFEDNGKKIVWREPLPLPFETGIVPVDVTFVLELDSLCVCLSNGDILLLDEEGAVEEVGAIAGGLRAAKWSPDGELLVLVSGIGTLLAMSIEWEVLLDEELSGLFEACDKEEIGNNGVGVAWRGDSQYFALSMKTNDKGCLCIWDRKSMQLHSKGEQPEELGPHVCWQPNGRHLYASTHVEGKSSVILYEKNGLRHGGFDVPTQKGKVVRLQWSQDSQLLVLVLEMDNGNDAQYALQIWRRNNWHWSMKHESRWPIDCGKIEALWDDQQGLKLHLLTNSGMYVSMDFVFDTCTSERGTAAVVAGNCVRLTPFGQVVIPPPMAGACIEFPAPVQSVGFLNGHTVEGVAVALSNGELAVMECEQENFWDELETDEDCSPSEGTSYPSLAYARGHVVSGAQFGAYIHSIKQLIWMSREHVLLVGPPAVNEQNEEGKGDVLLLVTIVNQGNRWLAGLVEVVGEVKEKITRAVGAKDGALLQLGTGDIVSYTPESSISKPIANSKLPEPCPWMVACSVIQDRYPVAVGLTNKGTLYWGGQTVASDVVSVTVRGAGPGGAFLLFTTKSSKLHIVQLEKLWTNSWELGQKSGTGAPDRITVGEKILRTGPTRDMNAAMRPPASVTEQYSLNVRAVEQGSRLIAAPGDTKVVIQMPRGNLETIHPRVLVLCAISEALLEKDYAMAWELATTNRVDLNIIVDYNWPSFISSAQKFIDDVQNEQDVCDLMITLKPNSVLDDGGLYSTAPLASPPSVEAASNPVEGGKVSATCKALRQAVIEMHGNKLLKAIVTSYARCSPPDLESALGVIKTAREAELDAVDQDGDSGQGGEALGPAESALKYLMLYVDPDALYRVALGMYDLEMAYMVITNAQRDPGEFLLELQRFASFQPAAFRQYHIDIHLRRFKTALANIVEAGEEHFETAVKLAKEQGLMHELLSLIKENDPRRNGVVKQAAEWLHEKGMYEDAGIAYVACGDLEKAVLSYKQGGHWEMCLSLAGRMEATPAKINSLAVDLYEELRSMGRLTEAAQIAVNYLDDVDNAVMLLAEARRWRESVRTAYQFNRGDLLETNVAPAAAECAESVLNEFRENSERVGKYLERLREVRAKRQAMETVVGETGAGIGDAGAIPNGVGHVDGEDGASTVGGLSVYTDRTVVGSTIASGSISALTVGGRKPPKRKKKNKGLRIRQGSPEEEAALCDHIKNLKPSAQTCEEIGQLNELLIILGHIEDAKVLQQELDTLIKAQKEAADDIEQNPPPQVNQKAHQNKGSTHSTVPEVTWKWDILRGSGK